MKSIFSVLMICVLLVSSGCSVLEAERLNRGGYLDKVADDHWFKADSKKMRALRAFAMQTSLARIASVSPKNEKDRRLMAMRIGDATVRATFLIYCAFGPNPLSGTVSAAAKDECFYFDSLMVDYTTSLFDLAMIAFPMEDTKDLLNLVVGGFAGPAGALDALNALLNLAKEALKYGRIIGALYRDTVELEVQVWLNTPDQKQDNMPPPYPITSDTVRALRAVYDRKNDDMAAWAREIAVLRNQGLEPIPAEKHFNELAALIEYLCGLIVPESADEKSPYRMCVGGLYLQPSTGAIGSQRPAAQSPRAKTSALHRGFLSSRVPFPQASLATRRDVPARLQNSSTEVNARRAALELAYQ